MGNKNKTISFRVNEDAFETLREIAEERDISLSAVFRDYVDMLVAHDGQVEVVPEHEVSDGGSSSSMESFFVREHERLELEAEHLREQLDEYKRYVTKLSQKVEEQEDEEVIMLDDLDDDREEEPFRIG